MITKPTDPEMFYECMNEAVAFLCYLATIRDIEDRSVLTMIKILLE